MKLSLVVDCLRQVLSGEGGSVLSVPSYMCHNTGCVESGLRGALASVPPIGKLVLTLIFVSSALNNSSRLEISV